MREQDKWLEKERKVLLSIYVEVRTRAIRVSIQSEDDDETVCALYLIMTRNAGNT